MYSLKVCVYVCFSEIIIPYHLNLLHAYILIQFIQLKTALNIIISPPFFLL